MPRLKAAVAGVGALGSIHARILARSQEAELVGVYDTDPVQAAKVAKEWKTAVLPSLDAIAERASACVVAVPTVMHEAVAVPLLLRGVSCLVEKPLAMTSASGMAIVEAAERGGAVLMVGHVERFNPAVQALLEKRIRPRFIESQRVSPFAFRSTDVGVVMDVMIHDIDLVLHLVPSEVRSVHAVGVSVVTAHEDLANARVLFADGTVANFTASRLAQKTERKLRCFSEECYVSLDFKEKSGRILTPAPGFRNALDRATMEQGRLSPLEVMLKRLVRSESLRVRPDLEPLAEEDHEFLSAVRERRAPLVTGLHGVRALRVAESVLASLRENAAVRGGAEPMKAAPASSSET